MFEFDAFALPERYESVNAMERVRTRRAEASG